MSRCPDCEVPGGGTDHTGRKRPNHMCRHDQFDLPPAGYVEIDPERVAAANEMKEACREIVERGRIDMAAAEEKVAADAEAEQRRQERMREDNRKELERMREQFTDKLINGGRC